MREEWLLEHAKAHPAFDPVRILDGCFDLQRQFILDPSRRKVAVTGRRAGKTVADVYHLLYTAALYPNSHVGYCAETRKVAKDLAWRDLSSITRIWYPDCRTNETELTVELPNKSIIRFFGANDVGEANKARGFPFRLFIIDEVEAIRGLVLKVLLEDVLTASLADYGGALVCTGTPDAACMGYLYEIDKGDKAAPWAHYHWTMADNEMFPRWAGRADWRDAAAGFIAAELQDMALDITHAFVRREYFGEWVPSADAFILHVDDKLNVYDPPAPTGLTYVLGIDLGFRDESVFVLTGFSVQEGRAYSVLETGHSSMAMGEIIGIARGLIERYHPVKTVIDPASGGANLVEELRHRYGVSVQYAEKESKAAFCRLWDADIRTGRYLFPRGSKSLAQSRSVQWNEKCTRELEGVPCDYFDASLYSWREAYHYLPKKKIVVQQELGEEQDLDFPSPAARRTRHSIYSRE
jgi:hypothetical protein